MNILSFDVEDWQQGFIHHGFDGWEKYKSKEEKNIILILELLARNNCKATFFVLGSLAEKCPNIVKMIHKEGHEIASHSYSHVVTPNLKPEEFRKDICKSKDILRDIIGEDIIGYRAPKWSVNEKTVWALQVLAEEGFKYDSSIFPSSFHEFGNSKYKAHPYRFIINGLSIIEFPAQVLLFGGLRFPAAGGFFLRAFPYFTSYYSLMKTNKLYNYGMVYLHPFEFDIDPPRIKTNLSFKIIRYYHLDKTTKYLSMLLHNFPFTDIRTILNKPIWNLVDGCTSLRNS
jgi:polysaccharide deacetylase family protein (PEP-CTERM system associated)